MVYISYIKSYISLPPYSAQSVVCCERLECEKVSVCAQLDAAVLALQQQHQAELAQLEERLRDFYSAEWDKAHQVYQDEADRCTALMRQQVGPHPKSPHNMQTFRQGRNVHFTRC